MMTHQNRFVHSKQTEKGREKLKKCSMSNLTISTINNQDLDELYQIEIAAHLVPWSKETFTNITQLFGLKVKLTSERYGIMGFALVSVIVDEAHILNIAIHPSFQGYGYGDYLLNRLLEIMQKRHLRSVFLEVRTSNQVAIALYEKRGFNEVGRRKGYYPTLTKAREDAIIMAHTFGNTFML